MADSFRHRLPSLLGFAAGAFAAVSMFFVLLGEGTLSAGLAIPSTAIVDSFSVPWDAREFLIGALAEPVNATIMLLMTAIPASLALRFAPASRASQP